MILKIDKFKTAIREKNNVFEPVFENMNFSCIKYSDYFEVSVYNIEDSILVVLKNKYEFIEHVELEVSSPEI